MYKRAFCWACAALLFYCFACVYLITCKGVDVSAAEVYTQWSVSDTAAFYGDLPFTYEIAGTTFSSTFSYIGGSAYGHDLISAVNIQSNSVLSTANAELYDVLVYRAQVRYTEQAIRNIAIPVDIFVTGGFRTFFGIPSTLTYSANSPNPNFTENTIADYPNNFISGGSAALPSASSPTYYNASSIRFPNNTGSSSYYGVTMRALTYDAVDGTISQLNFDGAYCIVDNLYLFVATPYSYGDISHDSPTTTAPPVTTTFPSGSGDINVNIDMTETNGLLDRILAAIQGIAQSILDGIKGLFIPDDDFMDGFKNDMSDLLEDHLGGLYEAEQIMVDAFGRFPEVAAKSEIYIPPATLNLAGTSYTVGNWHVPLKVEGVPALLYDGIAFIIDFLCLAAFLRMCRNKLEIFLNPDSEVVKE